MRTNTLFPDGSLLESISEPHLLNSLADGAYITDLNRKIVFWNRAAERITGWRAEDVVGKTCYDNILCHTDKDGHCLCGQDTCPLHRSIVTNSPSTEPVLVFALCKSQRRVPLEVSVAPITNDHGKVVGGIEVFRDLRNTMQDLMRARMIQEESMQHELPEDPRLSIQTLYRPREIVGGDFYRIETVNASHFALFIADAVGHGLAAALYTMQLRMLWENCRDKLLSPAFFMRTLNSRLHSLAHEAGFFSTAVYALYDATCGHLRCVRAGHPSPLVIRKNLSIETIGPGQEALGMSPDCSFTEAEAQLAAGDTLLMFSDGATEIYDVEERHLGMEGFKQIVHQLVITDPDRQLNLEVLAERLLEFANGIHLPDDLTLMTLRRLQ